MSGAAASLAVPDVQPFLTLLLHRGGFAFEQVPELDPRLSPSQRHRYSVAVSGTAPSLAVPELQPFRTPSLQTPSTRHPLVVQAPEPSDQVPAVSLSCVLAVHTQVRCRLQVSLVLDQTPLVVLHE